VKEAAQNSAEAAFKRVFLSKYGLLFISAASVKRASFSHCPLRVMHRRKRRKKKAAHPLIKPALVYEILYMNAYI